MGSFGVWIARLPLTTILRVRTPTWGLRWLLMDDSTSPEMVSAVRDAIKHVHPEVLAARVREALTIDLTDALKRCAVRLVCFVSAKDRLLSQFFFASIGAS